MGIKIFTPPHTSKFDHYISVTNQGFGFSAKFIKDITAKAELNKIYSGKVMKIMEFGAFVNFLGKQDGLVHISELVSELADKRVAKVTDVVKEGDEVKVKVIGFDRGKVKLSIKQAAV